MNPVGESTAPGKITLATEARIENGCIGKKETNMSRFLGSIVQFAEVLINEEIVALTGGFFFTHQIAPHRASNRA